MDDSWPGPEAAAAKAEKSEVRLGEPFDVVVAITHQVGERWSLDPAQKLEPFALLSQSQATEADVGKHEVTKITLKLALFKLDQNDVPALHLVAVDARGQKHAFSLPGPTVKGIAPDLGKDHEKRDIHAPVPVMVKNYRLLWLALGVLAALALLAWGLLWWRRRGKGEKPAAPVPELPVDEVALSALAELEHEGLPQSGHFKEFHLRLSSILRVYLGSRFGFHAIDMTSTELLDELGRRDTAGLKLADISWLCAQGDMAKFAKAQPTPDDCKEALSLARQAILRTRVRPQGVAGIRTETAA